MFTSILIVCAPFYVLAALLLFIFIVQTDSPTFKQKIFWLLVCLVFPISFGIAYFAPKNKPTSYVNKYKLPRQSSDV